MKAINFYLKNGNIATYNAKSYNKAFVIFSNWYDDSDIIDIKVTEYK